MLRPITTSLAALLTVALATAALLTGLSRDIRGEPDNPPEPATAPASKTATTAYVDLLQLLMNDRMLRREQIKITEEEQRQLRALEAEVRPVVEDLEAERKKWEKDTRPYINATDRLIEKMREAHLGRKQLELTARKEISQVGLEAFQRLRQLVKDESRARGYTQVLNIVRRFDELSETPDDLQSLLRQLMVSPVVVFDAEHDLTDIMIARADELWGLHISFAPEVRAESSDGTPLTRARDDDEADFHLRLGASARFIAPLLDREQPLHAEDPRAAVRWSRVGGGQLDDEGLYTAPEQWPDRGDVVVLTARSVEDPTVSARVRVRLLDKDGHRRPAAE
jgi:hypothetical protein